MKLVISNLVCPCCVLYVKDTLGKVGLTDAEVSMSGIDFQTAPSKEQMHDIEASLKIAGLEIVREKRNMMVERMKTIIRELLGTSNDPLKMNLSVYLTEQLHYNYSYLSTLFSEAEGMTIREFCAQLRIEQVKQMLVVEQLDLMEIAIRLDYSSTAHLASQFKKVTGLTTSEYKKEYTRNEIQMRMIG